MGPSSDTVKIIGWARLIRSFLNTPSKRISQVKFESLRKEKKIMKFYLSALVLGTFHERKGKKKGPRRKKSQQKAGSDDIRQTRD